MARNDALERLYDRLQAQREQILRVVSEELGELRLEHGDTSGSDEGDRAFQSINMDVSSRLAEQESRELRNIVRALMRFREGSYGQCELCAKSIPIARLEALPYTTVCVSCQEKIEADPQAAEQFAANWDRVTDNLDSGTFDLSQIDVERL